MKFALVCLLFIAAGVYSSPQGVRIGANVAANANADPGDIIGGVSDGINDATDAATGLIGDLFGGDDEENAGGDDEENAGGEDDATDDIGGATDAASDLIGGVGTVGGTVGGVINSLGAGKAVASIIATVRKILSTVLAPPTVNVICGILEALLQGKPFNIATRNLQAILKGLFDKNGLIPGATGTVKSLLGGKIQGSQVNQAQLDAALAKIQAELSRIAKPQIVAKVIALLRKIIIFVNGILSGILHGKGLGDLLGGLTGQIAGGVTVDAKGIDGVINAIRKILLKILSPTTVNVICGVLEALLKGKPLAPALKSLQAIIKGLTSKNGLVPGVLGTVKSLIGGVIKGNKVNEAQLDAALAKVQAELSRVLKPQIVAKVIQIIRKLILTLNGLIGHLLGGKGLGGVLSGLGLTGNGGLLNGVIGNGGLLGSLGLGDILGGGANANVGANVGANIGGGINADADAGLGIDF